MFKHVVERRKGKFLFISFWYDQNIYILTKDYTFINYTNNKRYVIPKGFKTDGATIPLFFRMFLNQMGRHTIAALIHDFFYVNKLETRFIADIEFLIRMLVSKVNPNKAILFYYVVRIGGKKWWKKVYKDNNIDISQLVENL